MKAINFTGASYEGIRIFKPIRSLLVCVKADSTASSATEQEIDLTAVKIRVRLINSSTGKTDEIVPNIALGVLGDIATTGEGFYVYNPKKECAVPVKLNEGGAVFLDNDKYLDVEISGLPSKAVTTIYGIEDRKVDQDFFMRYNKFYMSVGELQKSFARGVNEDLYLPHGLFSEVQLNCENGTTPVFTSEEIEQLNREENDINSVGSTVQGAGGALVMARYGLGTMAHLDLDGVRDFEIRRISATESIEFILLDAVK